MEIEGELEFEVEEILNSKLDQRYQTCPLRYLVKWLGYEGTEEEQTWVPATDVSNAHEALQAFHIRYPDRPGPDTPLPSKARA